MVSLLKKYGTLFIIIFISLIIFNLPDWIINTFPAPFGFNIMDFAFFIIIGLILVVFFKW